MGNTSIQWTDKTWSPIRADEEREGVPEMNERDERIRQQIIKSALSSCRHFNGIQHKTCEAGITYAHGSATVAMPCLPDLVHGRKTWGCDQFQVMTQEEAEREADEAIAAMNRTMNARIAAKDDAEAKGFGRGKGGTGSLKCPACDSGTLRYSVAGINGHMHARCSTAGCVSWME